MKRTLGLVLGISALMLLIIPLSIAVAQSDTCDLTINDTLTSIAQACGDLSSGEACFSDGDMLDLGDVTSLSTPTDTSFGVVMFTVPTDASDAGIRLTLFGDGEVVNAVDAPMTELPELPVSNGVGYAINLRDGAGTSFAQVGTLAWNAQTIADGRSADNQWVRLQREDGVAWAFVELITLDGDINELAVLDNPYTAPMQAFTLETSDSDACGSSGLMVEYSGDSSTQLQINAVDVEFGAGTFLVRAIADDALQIQVIDNEAVQVRVDAADGHVAAKTGESIQIALGGDNGLTPIAEAALEPSFSFASVVNSPLNLSDTANTVCLAGVVETDATLVSYSSPSSDADPSVDLTAEGHYQVLGYTEDESGARWLQVQDADNTAWIAEDSIETAGACANVLQIDPNATVSNQANFSSASGDLGNLLSDRSIWQANSGNEVQTGTCNFPPVAMCEHLVAVIPNADGTISWRGQEPQPYTMFAGGDNFFSFTGRNKLGNADLSMALTFHSESSWTMTMTQVFDNDPECIRTFNYTASRNW